MARIRTIKPEFWDSPSTASASPWARLAYIAMWNWADDYGRGTANLKELEGFIFPNDTFPQQWSGNTVTFRSVVAEVSECFGVTFYEVAGRPFYAIPSWERHQRNEKRAAQSRYPDPALATPNTEGAETPMQASVNPRISALGTGEQGNRGTDSLVTDSLTLIASESDEPKPTRYPVAFEDWWTHYPSKAAKGAALNAWRKAKGKTTPAALIAATDAYAASDKVRRGVVCNGATWLNAERWLDQLTTLAPTGTETFYTDADDLDD